AAVLLLRQMPRGYRPWPMLLAGLLLGVGVGVRLTVAPAALACAGFVLADRETPGRGRWVPALSLAAGFALALLPMAWTYHLAPWQFLFGNFGYPILNTAWREAGPHPRDTSPLGKILVFAFVCFAQPGNLLLLASAVLSL